MNLLSNLLLSTDIVIKLWQVFVRIRLHYEIALVCHTNYIKKENQSSLIWLVSSEFMLKLYKKQKSHQASCEGGTYNVFNLFKDNIKKTNKARE